MNAKTQAILNSLPEGLKKIEIHNKADLTGEPVAVRSDGLAQTGADTVISLSAKTGAGLDLPPIITPKASRGPCAWRIASIWRARAQARR